MAESEETAAPVADTPAADVKAVAPATVQPYRARKVREGSVVSAAMEKTVIVSVIERVRHPRYAKTVQRTKRFHAHDGFGDLKNGDRVRIVETRPMSKLKRWRVAEVLERAK